MDINDIRALITVLTFIAFIAIVTWAWSGRRQQAFEEAARMAMEDDDPNLGAN